MSLSLFDLFSIGIGPSSSHTVGPMLAALRFVNTLQTECDLKSIDAIEVNTYGSLALTGGGHGTYQAILNGLEGCDPETVAAETMDPRFNEICQSKTLKLAGTHEIHFDFSTHYKENQKEFLEKHSNAMRIAAFSAGKEIHQETYYSVGGGFVVTEQEFGHEPPPKAPLPLPFESGVDILELCKQHNITIAELMMRNETALQPKEEVIAGIHSIADVMFDCIDRGLHASGELPGGLRVKRRAGDLYRHLQSATDTQSIHESSDVMNWLNAFAMAVNEENAAGHRIVTAPTNGAAGVLPAVLNYYKELCPESNEQGIIDFFLTAAAIGILCKKNASISGAEVGCQGEVGSASAMAAAGLTAAWGGTPLQIENAAEIALEHHLGMTCDPVMGLVQIPCIERNAMGAVKAVNASRMALVGDGTHHVPLDKAIKTMFETGRDMMTIYKETSLGGLAVNVTEC